MKTLFLVFLGLLSTSAVAVTVEASDSIQTRETYVGVEFIGLTNRGLFTFSSTIISFSNTRVDAKVGFGLNKFIDFTNAFSPDFVIPVGVQIENQKFKNFRLHTGIAVASIRAIAPERETLLGSTEKRYTSLSPYAGLGYQHGFKQSKIALALDYYFIYDSNERIGHSAGLSFLYKLK